MHYRVKDHDVATRPGMARSMVEPQFRPQVYCPKSSKNFLSVKPREASEEETIVGLDSLQHSKSKQRDKSISISAD